MLRIYLQNRHRLKAADQPCYLNLIPCAFLISHVMGIKGEILNLLSLLSTFQTLKIIGYIHNTSGGSFFFSNLYVWSDLLCEYAPEEPSTRLVDNDDLGGKCEYESYLSYLEKKYCIE